MSPSGSRIVCGSGDSQQLTLSLNNEKYTDGAAKGVVKGRLYYGGLECVGAQWNYRMELAAPHSFTC
jgi:hypothetical protein